MRSCCSVSLSTILTGRTQMWEKDDEEARWPLWSWAITWIASMQQHLLTYKKRRRLCCVNPATCLPGLTWKIKQKRGIFKFSFPLSIYVSNDAAGGMAFGIILFTQSPLPVDTRDKYWIGRKEGANSNKETAAKRAWNKRSVGAPPLPNLLKSYSSKH